MRRFNIFLLSFMLCACSLQAYAPQSIEVAFSPSSEAVELIERTIGHAAHSIDVAAYSFTSEKVANALIAAHRRGIDVRVLLDKGQDNHHYHAIGEMQEAGIPIRINSHYAIMHNKYIIIDGKTVETGSFNYTTSAERRNAENVIVINDNRVLAKQYLENWQKLWNEADTY